MKAVNSRIQWSGRSWRLRVDSLLRPDGGLEEKGYVEHPGAVVLVPLQGDQVIMLRQYRAAVGETILELPAGTRGWDEDWLACAQRELREETGYRADRFVSLGQVWPAPGFSSERMAIFLATGLTPDPLPQDFDEQITLQTIPLDELVTMALDGRLQDAKSIAALLRTAHYQVGQRVG